MIVPVILLIALASAVLLAVELRSSRPRGVTLENFRDTCHDGCGMPRMRDNRRTDERVQRAGERIHRALYPRSTR